MSNRRSSRTRAALGLALALLQALPAYAGTVTFSRGGLNARSSANFYGSSNVLTTVPKGTEGDIIGKPLKLPSRNYAVHLKITKLGSGGATSLEVDQEIWVYYHQLDKDERRIALYDDDGKLQENAGTGTWAKAISDFKTTKVAEKKETDCTTCQSNGTPPEDFQPLSNALLNDVAKITDVVQKEGEKSINSNDVPNLDPTVEELATYIQTRRTAKGVKETLESARTIARLILEKCLARGVPTEFALITAAVETREGFEPKQKVSNKGAAGLMQIIPSTYAWLKYGIDAYAYKKLSKAKKNAYVTECRGMSLEENVDLSVKYMKEFLDRYKGNYRAAWAAYNGNQGDRVLKGKAPTKRETRNYLKYADTYLATYRLYAVSLAKEENSFVASN